MPVAGTPRNVPEWVPSALHGDHLIDRIAPIGEGGQDLLEDLGQGRSTMHDGKTARISVRNHMTRLHPVECWIIRQGPEDAVRGASPSGSGEPRHVHVLPRSGTIAEGHRAM